MVGAYAGVSISDQINTFLKQGWKMILIGVFVMTGTCVFSAIIAQMGLMATGAIQEVNMVDLRITHVSVLTEDGTIAKLAEKYEIADMVTLK